MLKRFVCAVVLLGIVVEWAHSQSFYAVRRNRELIATVGSGTANYFGEMVNPGELGKLKPNLVVGAEYYWFPRISTRAELTWFQTAGDDALANDDRTERNLNFISNNFELSVTGTVNALAIPQRFYQRPVINVFGFVGVGLLYFNPRTEYQGKMYALAPLQTEGVKYSRWQPVIPFGAGIKYKPHPYFNIVVEGGYRLAFTDYLDDASSTRYPDPTILQSDLSRALSDRRGEIGKKPKNYLAGKRGNPSNNDGYFLFNAKVQYYLPLELFNSTKKLYRKRRTNSIKRNPIFRRRRR